MRQKSSPRKISRLSTNSPISTAARWQAVVSRDRSADKFVYGVLTTRIYCRPCCPARLARRANVIFYDTPAQAQAAGFRPCKRCKPEAVNPQQQLIQKACATIESEIKAGLKPKLQRLAEEANLTPSHFHRVFRRTLGVTPGQYAARILNTHRESGNEANRSLIPAQICDINILDPCSAPVASEIDPGTDDWVPWNEFDFLIAAENRLGNGNCLEDCLSPIVDFRNLEDSTANLSWEEQALEIPGGSMAYMDGTEPLAIPP